MSLEQLLRTKIPAKTKDGVDIEISPEFRVAVQSLEGKGDFKGVHIIIHANGHNSDTLDFLVNGNELTLIR